MELCVKYFAIPSAVFAVCTGLKILTLEKGRIFEDKRRKGGVM
mgnify:CR=1 FL=1